MDSGDRSQSDAQRIFLLDSSDIAIGVVAEHDNHDGNVVPDCGCHFLCVEHESAVAGDGDHRLVRAGHFGTECAGIAPAQGALVTTGETLSYIPQNNLVNFRDSMRTPL